MSGEPFNITKLDGQTEDDFAEFNAARQALSGLKETLAQRANEEGWGEYDLSFEVFHEICEIVAIMMTFNIGRLGSAMDKAERFRVYSRLKDLHTQLNAAVRLARQRLEEVPALQHEQVYTSIIQNAEKVLQQFPTDLMRKRS